MLRREVNVPVGFVNTLVPETARDIARPSECGPRRSTVHAPTFVRKISLRSPRANSGERLAGGRHTAERVAAVRRAVRRSAMVGLGLNLGDLARGDGPAAPLTSRGDADGNVIVHEKTVDPDETRRGEASSSSGSEDDSDDDAPLAERLVPTTRPAGLPSLGLGLGTRGAPAAGGSTVSSPTSPPSGTSLSARKPPGLGLRIGGVVGAGDVDSGDGRPSAIDLESLRASGETQASELTIRREKFAHFEKHCTRVAPSVFVAGEAVARNLETLREHAITHVINCNAFVVRNHFEDALEYKALWLQDSPGEDVTRVLYDCFDFIRAAIAAGGNVLVHCSQGVSRSVSVVISFLMWESGASYEEAFARVKAQRGIANPNMGFTCQMLQWRKRVAAETARGDPPPDPDPSDPLREYLVPRTRVYRMAPHSEHDPRYLVAKLCEVADAQTETPGSVSETNASLWSTLDARGAFVVAPRETSSRAERKKKRAFVWVGPRCVDERAFVERARVFARQLWEYDGLGGAWGARAADEAEAEKRMEEFFSVVVARGGEEPPDLASALGGDADVAPSGAWARAASARVASYDADFEMYVAGVRSQAARRGGVAAESASPSARAERPGAAFSARAPRNERGAAGPRPRSISLLTYPEFDPVTIYDEDDLDPASVLVLLAGRAAEAAADGAARVENVENVENVSRVWIGRGVDDGGHARVFGARLAEEVAARIAETFGETHVVRVENEGNESEAFWEAFEAGQA